MTMGEVTYDKLVATYVKIRDARAAATAEHKAKDDAMKAQQERLEVFLLQQMQDTGMESFKTSAGTAYRTETMVPGSNDWDAFYKWVHETHGYDFFFKRIKADAVRDYMDQHNGETPPGVTVFSKFGVTVRRK
jgi:hypothetical protein